MSLRQLAATLKAEPATVASRVGRNGALSDLEERVRRAQYQELRRQMEALQVETVRQLHARRRADRTGDGDGGRCLQVDLPSWSDLSTLLSVNREMHEFLSDQLDELGLLSASLKARRAGQASRREDSARAPSDGLDRRRP